MSAAGSRLLVFNFAVSYSGGGLKRLEEYAKWFDSAGGATFIVHSNCASLALRYPRNRYFIEHQLKLQRLWNDCAYLGKIIAAVGRPDFYYSYGIPVYVPLGAVNWFHLSNVLPLHSRGIPLDWRDRFAMKYLGWRIRKNFIHADVISAESAHSLELIGTAGEGKRFLSVNGSDDELEFIRQGWRGEVEEIAVVVGTYRYKALLDCWRIFEHVRRRNARLELVVIGNEKYVPPALREQRGVRLAGLIPRARAMEYLRRSRCYISATLIENSYNAASEGIFCAEESYISDIGPHRELLADSTFARLEIDGLSRPVLHVRRAEASAKGLRTWDQVITGMMAKFESELNRGRAG